MRGIVFDDVNGIAFGTYSGVKITDSKLLDPNYVNTKPQYPNVAGDPIYVPDPDVSGNFTFTEFNAYGPHVYLPETNSSYPEAEVILVVPDVQVGP